MNSYTPNIALAQPQLGDTGWSTPLNSNSSALDALNAIADLCVTTKEQPSASLNVKVSAGMVIAQDGSTVTFAGAASQACTPSTTSYLLLDGTAGWALSVATTFPTTPHVKLASVSTGTTSISAIADFRQAFNVAGSIKDGTVWSTGLTAGLTISAATTQKLGFYGAAPVVQSTGGSATASVAYSTNEQSMLQKSYACLRSLGLLS